MAVPELEAMGTIAQALEGLEDDERGRVLGWAIAKFGGPDLQTQSKGRGESSGGANGSTRSGVGHPVELNDSFSEFGDLYHAASPSNNEEKALVAGYWEHVIGQESFASQTINSNLKDLGEGVANITQALTGLIKRKPNLVMQTKKTGTARQGRKTYKLTAAGKKKVSQMLSGVDSDDSTD